jgi:peptidoglycan hydrolase-like protein with peptidoglycan-binding domain
MRTTYWVPGARRRGFSLVAGLAVLCFVGTMVGGSPAQAETARAESGLLTMGDGYAQPHGSTRVRALQRRLRTLGLRPGSVDGLFGPRTRAAVESLQTTAGLHVDGIVGPDTRQALRRASAPVLGLGAGYDTRGGSLQVRRLQRQLRGLGLRPGPVDGLYGPRTAAAVARFQRRRGTTADGAAWFRTRRAIASARRNANRRFARNTRPATQPGEPTRVAPIPAHIKATPAADEEPPRLPLLVLIGLLAFTLVALATPLARRVTLATVSGLTRPDAGTPANGPRAESSESPVTQAVEAAQPDRETDGVEAVGYVAVPQTGEEAKVDVRRQIGAMDAECERRGWRLIEVARDIGAVRPSALDRPGLSYALERLAGRGTACLIVAELSQLGRSRAELTGVVRSLREQGVHLIAVDVGLDTAATEGRIAADALLSIDAGVPRRGGRPGRPAVDDVPALKEHIVAMRSAGMTLQAIADRLNEEGVPTLRGGREWRPSSVQVAAGYRRPRKLIANRRSHDWTGNRQRTEEP